MKHIDPEIVKMCIIPSMELRTVVGFGEFGEKWSKLQQKHYNHPQTHFVWRDVDVVDSYWNKDALNEISFE